jgi:carbonic anhydrase
MKKLIQGILEFRRTASSETKKRFARLALGQFPDALFIGCSDSRVAANVFASTDPGDLFVTRNVGNLVPPWQGKSTSGNKGDAVAAVIDFALTNLNVSNIIVCGHSECGAMQALVANGRILQDSPVKDWLGHGAEALKWLEDRPQFATHLERHNRLSQINVLLQLEHLKTYPSVQERVNAGSLHLHGWWFELKNAEVFAYEEDFGCFVVIDDAQADRILRKIGQV